MEKCYITQELRFTFDGHGKLVNIAPISPDEFKEPEKKEYRTEKLCKLDIDRSMERMAVVFYGKKNPTCTKWVAYDLGYDWLEICVEWST